MTKLEAVQSVLRAAGQRPVPSLDTGNASMASEAERSIDEFERNIQSTGWLYNSRIKVTLTPDSNGRIAVPIGVFAIDTDDESAYKHVVVKDGYLFDIEKNVDTFDGPLKVTYVLRYEWGCIPEPIQRYIVSSAALEFNARYGRPELARYISNNVFTDKARADRYNQNTADVNILKSGDAIKAKGGYRYSANDIFGIRNV